jgi:hypothetical protein
MRHICIKLVDYFHLYVALYPFLVNLMPLSISYNNTAYYYHHKIMILLCILVPSHWGLLNDKCIITIISEKLGDTSLNIEHSENIENIENIKNIKYDDNDNDNDEAKKEIFSSDEEEYVDNNSPFIEKYARPTCEKILNIFGAKWDAKTSQKFIYGFWFVNHIILWNHLYNNLAEMQSRL